MDLINHIVDSIRLRRMIKEDYTRMLEWRLESEVMRYYGNPNEIYTLERVIQKYEARIEGRDHKIPLIIEFNEIPVGYLQYYIVDEKEKNTYGLLISEGVIRIDIFIGSQDFRN